MQQFDICMQSNRNKVFSWNWQPNTVRIDCSTSTTLKWKFCGYERHSIIFAYFLFFFFVWSSNKCSVLSVIRAHRKQTGKSRDKHGVPTASHCLLNAVKIIIYFYYPFFSLVVWWSPFVRVDLITNCALCTPTPPNKYEKWLFNFDCK